MDANVSGISSAVPPRSTAPDAFYLSYTYERAPLFFRLLKIWKNLLHESCFVLRRKLDEAFEFFFVVIFWDFNVSYRILEEELSKKGLKVPFYAVTLLVPRKLPVDFIFTDTTRLLILEMRRCSSKSTIYV